MLQKILVSIRPIAGQENRLTDVKCKNLRDDIFNTTGMDIGEPDEAVDRGN
mgnify:CR=1 FL=1